MDKKNEKDIERKQEVKWFCIYVVIMLAFLFVFFKINNMISYASEVMIAEEPSNVGGSNGIYVLETDSGSSVLCSTSGGSGENLYSEKAPYIIYAFDSVSRAAFVNNYVSIHSNIDSADEINQSKQENSGMVSSENADLERRTSSEEVNEVDIYVPDSDDDCPVSDKVPLSVDIQNYIWTKCKRATSDYKNYYVFILGVIQKESEFKPSAIHYNKNGTVDRGLMQVNSCRVSICKKLGLISCTDDLWDVWRNIDCGFQEMDYYIDRFGVCEDAYFGYNTGRQNGGSNAASRDVMQYMGNWKQIIFG